jgi:hypothetical protein
LHIQEVNGKVLFKCFACCSQEAVLDALRARGLWPVPGTIPRTALTPRRSADERREYALKILADTAANRGHKLAPELALYFGRRGIKSVPPTAMLALPWKMTAGGERLLVPDDPAIVAAVTNGREIVGCHVTWLNASLTDKREEEPKRQFFGPIAGGFIKLYAGELEPTAKLIIGEGSESAAAASQIAGGLPAIAALSANNLPKITPPPAGEYIIAADHDDAGLRGARALAFKLVRAGHVVRLAIPPRAGTDWNDELMRMM